MFSILVSVQFGHYRLNPGNAQNFLGRKLLLGLSILNTLWRDFIINQEDIQNERPTSVCEIEIFAILNQVKSMDREK